MLALDTETTGLDPWHGSKPFLVTICDEDSNIMYWEWDVNPLTREPIIPKKDIKEIKSIIHGEYIVLHNSQFDVRMLHNIGIDWDWEKTYDSMISSHIINTGKPKNLTYCALDYLNVDVGDYEDNIKDAATRARRIAKRNYPNWMIADEGMECMPSVKSTVWKCDLWLPRALLKHGTDEELPESFETVVSEYANCDSEVTMLLFKRHIELLKENDLWELYKQRLKLLPIVYDMENRGVTLSGSRLNKLIKKYTKQSDKAKAVCENIALSYDYELTLPKSGNNKSLHSFVFDVLKLEPVSVSKKTGVPSLNKEALETYKRDLRSNSKQSRFIANLTNKRKRDTAITYMKGYKNFMLPIKNGENWYVLHPFLNITGTTTLRCSSKNPNEQNISKQEGFNLRYAFGPAPGREWWSIDYNNLELRLNAYESGEEIMIELFEKPDEPPFYGSYHLMNASIIYPDLFDNAGDGNEFKKKYPIWYHRAKCFGFAVSYGAQPESGTADRQAHKEGAQMLVINRLKKQKKLSDYWVSYARRKGYVETIPDKTVNPRRGFPIYCPKERGYISPTIPLSYHIQSTGCWVMEKAMVKVNEFLPKDYFITMQVHDELVLDFPYKKDRGNYDIIQEVNKLMESCGDDIGIPLTCGIEYHPRNWGSSE